jgi:hypothetical protein
MSASVKIMSDLSAESGSIGIGDVLFEETRLRINWIQPAGEGEALGVKYSLTYDTLTGVLEVERFSNHISRMAFCEGARTRGELRTVEGCFETEIFTHRLTVPENGFGEIVLLYDLLTDGQEPMHNTLVISVSEAAAE